MVVLVFSLFVVFSVLWEGLVVSVLLVLWVTRECSKEHTLHTERSTPAGYVYHSLVQVTL